jgi:hypothetical protein
MITAGDIQIFSNFIVRLQLRTEDQQEAPRVKSQAPNKFKILRFHYSICFRFGISNLEF